MALLDKIDPSQPETCKIPWCKECGGAYLILIVVASLIMFYFIFRSGISSKGVIHNDVMNIKIFDLPMLENCCSAWPLSHFFLFFILGVLFPDCGIPLIAIGALWELFEVFASTLESKDRQPIRASKNSNIEYSVNWWAGSTKDIVMNIAGFLTGWFVAKKLGGKMCIKGLNSETRWCKDKESDQKEPWTCDHEVCVSHTQY